MRINISVPDELYNQVKAYSKEFDLKMSSIFRQGAKEILKKENANN